MNPGCGEYRIEYLDDDGELLDAELAMSLGAARQQADARCDQPDNAACGYRVMRCVCTSQDGVISW